MCKSLKSIFVGCSNLQLVWTVLNPAMCFSWIQAEWEGKYIQCAKDTILMLDYTFQLSHCFSHDLQMCQYHSQESSMSEATITDSSIQPALVSMAQQAPTWSKVQDSVYNKRSTCNTFTVEAEFQKYVLGLILSEDTNILWFWEVRWFLWLNGILALQLTPSTGQ